MKTQGEIEAAICEGISRFEQEYMGRGPKDIRAHLIGDLLVVRLQGVLTAAEQHLVKSLPAEKGETCSNKYGPICSKRRDRSWRRWSRKSPASRLSLHHDISTVTGEEVVLFTLAASRRQVREDEEEVRLNVNERDSHVRRPRFSTGRAWSWVIWAVRTYLNSTWPGGTGCASSGAT